MSVPHVSKPADLLDRLVDVPPTKDECAQILAFFLPRVADCSPAVEGSAYGQARRELCAATHLDLKPLYFEEGVELGQEVTVRASGFQTAGPYSHLSADALEDAFSFIVDCLVEDVSR